MLLTVQSSKRSAHKQKCTASNSRELPSILPFQLLDFTHQLDVFKSLVQKSSYYFGT